MMGFNTINLAIARQLVVNRQPDQRGNYVVEVKFNDDDNVRYWIDKQTFLIDKVVTRYSSTVMIEEERSDYRKVSCMTLPFRIVTKLRGQRLADLTISQLRPPNGRPRRPLHDDGDAVIKTPKGSNMIARGKRVCAPPLD